MWTDFQVLNQLIRKNMYITQYFHLICNMLVHYRVKLENPKNINDFDSIRNKLSICSWGHLEDLI